MNGKRSVKSPMKSKIASPFSSDLIRFLRLDFEAEVNILKNKTEERQKQFDIERDRLYEQMKTIEKTRDELTKENTHLNSTLTHMKDSQNELEREKEKNRELYKKTIQLESQLASTNGIEVIILVIL